MPSWRLRSTTSESWLGQRRSHVVGFLLDLPAVAVTWRRIARTPAFLISWCIRQEPRQHGRNDRCGTWTAHGDQVFRSAPRHLPARRAAGSSGGAVMTRPYFVSVEDVRKIVAENGLA